MEVHFFGWAIAVLLCSLLLTDACSAIVRKYLIYPTSRFSAIVGVILIMDKTDSVASLWVPVMLSRSSKDMYLSWACVASYYICMCIFGLICSEASTGGLDWMELLDSMCLQRDCFSISIFLYLDFGLCCTLLLDVLISSSHILSWLMVSVTEIDIMVSL